MFVATELDLYDETSGQFPAVFVETEPGKQKQNLYRTLTKSNLIKSKVFFVPQPNQTIHTASS